MTFTKRFKLAVEEAVNSGISKTKLSKLLNLSPKTFFNYYNGVTSPDVNNLPLFNKVFNKPNGWFIGVGNENYLVLHNKFEQLKKNYSELQAKNKENQELIKYMKYVIDLAKLEDRIK